MSEGKNLVIKKEDNNDLLSLGNIKFPPLLPSPVIIRPRRRVVDDDVQFVKAERIRPTPKDIPPELFENTTTPEEPISDPLAVNRSYPCSQCKKIFATAQHLIEHVQRHAEPKVRKKPPKPKPENLPTSFTCPYCNTNFDREKSLAGHLHIHKGRVSENAIKCKDCDAMFNSKGSLWNHRKKKHTNTLYKCTICNETFITKPAHEKHMKRHEDEGAMVCDICGKTFAMKENLRIHMRVHSGERPFLCDDCGKSFSSNLALLKHVRRHRGETRHSCDICGKKFYETTELRKHRYIHTKDKPHKCDLCGKGFVFPASMREHRRVHTGEKPYKCTYDDSCQRYFRNLTQMKRHVEGAHKGQKPHKCEICARAFLDKGSLKEHMKRIHQNPSQNYGFECSSHDCGMEFKSVQDLKQHQDHHHHHVAMFPPVVKEDSGEHDQLQIENQTFYNHQGNSLGTRYLLDSTEVNI